MNPQPDDLRDVDLLKRIARGDTQAFDVFYQRYSALLYTYILRLTRHDQQAEDLLQETFLAVWQNAHQFRGRSQVRTWLLSIAHRRTMEWLRARSGFNEEQHAQLDEWQRDGQADVSEQVLSAIREEEIRTALAQLSPDQRAVLELAFYYNFSYAEIAEIMDCPVGTVRSRLHAARQQLQVLLSHLVRAGVTSSGGSE